MVPDGVQLSSLQQWFIDMYNSSDSWYLIPKWKFLSMAQYCELAFGFMFLVLVIMAVCFVWKRFIRKAA